MADAFEPQDGLTERLRALGQVPVDPAAQAAHLTAMAQAAAAPSLLGTFAGRLRVAAALVVGFMLGTTGLASAGALGPLQPIAATAIEATTPLDVPDGDAGTTRFRGDGDQACEAVEYKNHGQYIKAVRKEFGKASTQYAAAKQSDCGKPVSSLGGDDADLNADKESKEESGEPKGKANGKANKDAKSNGKAKASGSDTDDEAPGKAEAACAGGAANGNAGGVEAPAGPDSSVKPAEDALGKPECADEQQTANDARTAGDDSTGDAEGADASAKDADSDDEADERKPETPAGPPAGTGPSGS